MSHPTQDLWEHLRSYRTAAIMGAKCMVVLFQESSGHLAGLHHPASRDRQRVLRKVDLHPCPSVLYQRSRIDVSSTAI